jgi:outer membrane protein TolC
MRLLSPLLAVVCALCLAGVAAAQGGEILTLERAIAIAEQNNLQLAAAAARRDAAESETVRARGSRWPGLRLEAGFQTTNNPVLVFSQKLLQGNFQASDFELDVLNTPDFYEDWAASLVLEQPIWTGGRIAGAVTATEAAAAAAAAELERARQQLVRDVTDRYTGAVLADYALASARASLETARANVELVTDLREAGLVVESDLLLAQVRESEVEELVIRAEAAVEVAAAALNVALGRDQSMPLTLPDELGEVGGEESALDPLVSRALEQRPDLLAARHYLEAARGELRMEQGGWRPELGLTASAETHAEDFFGNDGDNATVAVGFKFPLFEGKSNRAEIQRAEAAIREAEAMAELMAQRAELEVRQSLAALESARKRLALALEGIALAERSLVIVEDRYRNGLTTLVDLLEAESALTQSRRREVEARRDVLVARAGLDLATGDL